jgi:hypothetical protein
VANVPNTTYGRVKSPYVDSDRLREQNANGEVCNAIVVEFPIRYPEDEGRWVETISGQGTTLKQARSEARAYAAKRGYTIYP